MSTVKFIVPEGNTKAGEVREVPESDAASFDEMGWERAEKKNAEKGNNKNK